ncbi:MAG: hypothetical protein QW641_03415 [Candidatus Aenigmatarchaeota archaeon]
MIINLCKDELSYYEFVKPIEKILNEKSIHYKQIKNADIEKASKVIICGTALKDFDYLKNLEYFNWLKGFEKPVLAICAGAQVIGCLNKLKLKTKTIIGSFEIDIVKENELTKEKKIKVYCLFSKYILPNKNFEVIGYLNKIPVFLRKQNSLQFLTMFHPEVFNEDIIKNWIKLF